jgi:hypothetical protein
MEISWTLELAYSSSPPIGAKMTPTPNRSGRTVLGVRMGCQAFRRCWRKAVSILHHQRCHFQAQCAGSRLADVLGGLLLFCFLSGSSFSRKLPESVCSMVCDMMGVCDPSSRREGGSDYCTERDVGCARVVAAFQRRLGRSSAPARVCPPSLRRFADYTSCASKESSA